MDELPRPEAVDVLRRLEQTHPDAVRAAVAEAQRDLLAARLAELIKDRDDG